MVTKNTAAENVPKAQFGLKSPRCSFLMGLSCVMSFANIQQIDLFTGPQKDHKKKRQTSKDSAGYRCLWGKKEKKKKKKKEKGKRRKGRPQPHKFNMACNHTSEQLVEALR